MENFQVVNTPNELRLKENVTILKGFIEDLYLTIDLQKKIIERQLEEIQDFNSILNSKKNKRKPEHLKIV